MSTAQAVVEVLQPVQNPLAAWRELGGEVVIISPQDSVLHELNQTASLIWKLATGTRGIPEIARQVAAEFEVDEATALADTRSFVEELCSKGLLLPEAAGVARG
jgi:hypothetical protein